MNNSMSCSHGRWCTRADTLLGAEGIHISSVTATEAGLVLGVETGRMSPAVRTAVSLPWAMADGPSGSRTSRVSAGRCGCYGPSASGDVRTRTARERRSRSVKAGAKKVSADFSWPRLKFPGGLPGDESTPNSDLPPRLKP
jgi:hypothetical protein